nr:hypothetical protein [Kibdelosporangium sp. MJ126-NF4]
MVITREQRSPSPAAGFDLTSRWGTGPDRVLVHGYRAALY